ncbi:MAG: T9SS type A sorting domain-containing protein [Paludibacter sp.]
MKQINVFNHENHINLTRLNRVLSYFVFILFSFLPFNLSFADTVTLTTTSTSPWLCPAGVTSIQIECWAAGGGGGGATSATNRGGGGGAGGAYIKNTTVAVTPGVSYTFSVGAGGTAGGTSTASSTGGAGGNTSITIGALTYTAVGGAGGTGGASANSGNGPGATGSSTGNLNFEGSFSYAGGNGATAVGTSYSGGGGGAAGSNGAGGNASGSTGGTAGTGGGIGAAGIVTSGTAGIAGTVPGGGGSGGHTNSGTPKAGGAGGAGRIVITYSSGPAAPSVTTTAVTSLTSTAATMNGNITADNGATITDRGFCYKTAIGVLITDNFTSEGGTATGAYSKPFTGLSVNTQYFYKAYATNSQGTTLSSTEMSFYTLADVPDAPTLSAASQTYMSVAVNSSTNPATTQYAIYETTTSTYVQADGTLGASAVWQTAATWGTKTVSGLTALTSYTFEVKARNGANTETAFGSTASLSTLPNSSPTLSVGAITAFGSQCINTTTGPNSFTITGANLTPADVTVAGLSGYSYSTTSDGTYTTTLTLTQAGGSLSQEVFVKFTPVAVQSYDGNIAISGGGATSLNRSVTGSGINTAATVTTTSPATSITVSTVTLGGNVTDAGCQAVTARGICYGTTLNPDLTGSFTTESGTTGVVSSNITGLLPNTLYHFRAYATTTAGTSYGSDVTFTTAGLTAPVANEASVILWDSFTANWSAVAGATSYLLDVSSNSNFATTNLSEDFSKCTLGTPITVDATDFTTLGIDTYMNTTGWAGSKLYQGGGTIRVGSTGTVGYITTPTVDLSANGGNATLTFDCNSYSTDASVQVQVWHAADGTNFTQVGTYITAPATLTGQTFAITGGTTSSKIKITSQAALKRFILDNLKIQQNMNLAGYDNLTVNGTSQVVSGLNPETNYYYRVRAYCPQSTSSNSNTINLTTSITTTNSKFESSEIISVYPNPTNSSIVVKGSDIQGIELFDMAGLRILKTNESKVNLSELSKGFYLAKIKTSNGSIIKKIEKN